jgi:hypothetical protein
MHGGFPRAGSPWPVTQSGNWLAPAGNIPATPLGQACLLALEHLPEHLQYVLLRREPPNPFLQCGIGIPALHVHRAHYISMGNVMAMPTMETVALTVILVDVTALRTRLRGIGGVHGLQPGTSRLGPARRSFLQI